MKKLLSIFLLASIIISCAAPITQTSFIYSGSDTMDKMITALVDTKWEITHTDKSTGLIVAKKITSSEQFFSGDDAKAHVVTVKIAGNNVDIAVKYQGNDFLGAEKDKCNKLKDKIIARFNELTK